MANKSVNPSSAGRRERAVRSSLWIWAVMSAVLLVLIVVVVVVLRSPKDRPADIFTPAVTPEPTPVMTSVPTITPAVSEAPDISKELRTRYENRQYGFPVMSLDKSLLRKGADGRMVYDGDQQTLTGIDVSEHQYDIDWETVAAQGIDFVMIRLGRRGSTAGGLYIDEYYEANIAGALAAGLRVGVYFYSQAIDTAEAREEANYVLDAIGDYEITMPVVFDWEIVGGSEARTNGVSRHMLCDCAAAFCDTVAEAGYDPMIYFTRHLGYRRYILRELTDYGFWYAEYEDQPSTVFDFSMWQYSDTSHVDGIDGDVDMDIYFLPGD